jgi:hypothetical protein
MDRLSDRVCDMVEDALTRLLAFGEQVDAIEFQLTIMPNQLGQPMTVGLIHLALKGPIIGQALRNTDVIPDLQMLDRQDAIDESVRRCLDMLRGMRAQVLAGSNGH